MNKRDFIKSLLAFGVLSLTPSNIFSQVAEHKKCSTINGIPIDIIKFEPIVIKHSHTQEINPTKWVMDFYYSLEASLEIRGRVYHNIADKITVIYQLEPNCLWNVSGEVIKQRIESNKTYLYLNNCKAFIVPEEATKFNV